MSSLSDIEREAREIIERAKREAEEILRKAREEAESWKSAEISAPLTEEEIKEIEEEFRVKLKKAQENFEKNKQALKERYSQYKGEIISKVVELVAGTAQGS